MFILCTLIGVLIILGICLDVRKKINLMHVSIISLFLIFVPHISLLIYLFTKYISKEISLVWQWIIIFEVAIFIIYLWVKINFFINSRNPIDNYRLRILLAGRKLIYYGLYGGMIQILIYKYAYIFSNRFDILHYVWILDIIVTVLFVATLIINGCLRILCTSRRLNIIKRIIVAWTLLIPFINIFVMLYVCHLAKIEYDHECYKINLKKIRIDSEVCKTKYPFVLIHGVGFRDIKYINYWGRIPKELIRNGATIYYGNQEAFGTVEYNAYDIKEKILDIVNTTGCKKVNIIAHSKGGLDARYMISKLDMGKYVASITTMSSPHKGVKFVDIACHIPDKIYKAIAVVFNKYFRAIGDKNPNFYTATREFSTYHSKKFNEEVKDVQEVYYQSYATVMNNMLSDYILTIPYILVKLTEGENDGLVAVDSAKWGEFKGILKNKRHRGISHGDIIDLRRDDYREFDVIEKYVEIVSELKNKGF